MTIGLYSLVSDVHNEGYINKTLTGFINDIESKIGGKFVDCNPSNMGSMDLTVIFIKSGGVEGKFKDIYESFNEPYLLLSSGTHNSFAASLEILSFLRQKGKRAEILHGDAAYIAGKIKNLHNISQARKRLGSARVGVIGKPSDWLIASYADYERTKEVLGIDIIDIDMKELVDEINKDYKVQSPRIAEINSKGFDKDAVKGALKIYSGLKSIVNKYNLQGVTVRCFDLLGIYKNTGCLAVSLLNEEGIIAGCEGDVPALISMMVLNYLTGEPAFMANPSSIDVWNNQAILAHCTLPLHMASKYNLDTHFESGLGVGIKGIIQTGKGTIFKLSGDLRRMFVSGINIRENLNSPNLCRTQIRVEIDENVNYFLKDPIGNHHIVCRGDYSGLIKEFFNYLK